MGIAPRAPFDLKVHSAHQPVTRSCEAAGEGAVVVGAVVLARDLLAVNVLEHHRQLLALEHLVVVLGLVHPDADAFVLDGLDGPVDGAVGEEGG